MAGRVIKENIQLERLVGQGEVQTQVESAVMLGGERGVQLVAADVKCEIRSAETQADGIAVQGAVYGKVLWLAPAGAMHADRVQSDFSAVIPVEGAVTGQRADVKGSVGGVAAAERDGKLTVTVQVMLSGVVVEAVQRQTAVDAAAQEEMAKRMLSIQLMQTTAAVQTSERLTESVPLIQMGMSQVIWHRAAAEVMHVQMMDGAAEISGVVKCDCLLTDEAQRETVWQKMEIPYAVELVSDAFRSDTRLCVDAQIADADVRMEGASEDESAALHAECVLKMSATGYGTQEVNVLSDLYPLTEEPFEAAFATLGYVTELKEAEQSAVVEAVLELTEDAPVIRQIVGVFAAPVMMEVVEDSSLRTEGLLRVTLLYRTDGQDALVCYEQEVPFGVTFDEIPGTAQIWQAELEEAEVQRISPVQAQVRVTLEVKAVERTGAQTNVVEEISYEGEPVELEDGITVYYPEPNEDRWAIAKRYRVREDDLKTLGEGGKTPVMVYRRLTEF